jgi:hypothetical protein
LAEADPLTLSAGKSKLSKQAFVNDLLQNEKVAISDVLPDIVGDIKFNDRDYKVYIESVNDEKLDALAKENEVLQLQSAVTVDDEYFWDGEAADVTVPVYLSSTENSTTSVTT